MNLVNNAFKAAFKGFLENIKTGGKGIKGKVKEALGESATELSLKEIPKITDPEKLKAIQEGTEGFRTRVIEGQLSRKGEREIESAAVGLARSEAADIEIKTEDVIDKINKQIFDVEANDTMTKTEVDIIANNIEGYYKGLPLELEDAVRFFRENKYDEGRKAVKDAIYNATLHKQDALINGALADTFVDPNFVNNVIKKNKDNTYKSIFKPREASTETLSMKDGELKVEKMKQEKMSKFEAAKNKYIDEQIEKQTKDESFKPEDLEKLRKRTEEQFNAEYAVPKDMETATADELEKAVKWYNSRVPEKDRVEYGMKQVLQDKLTLHTIAQKQLGEFGVDMKATELTQNGLLKLMKAGGGLVTNMAKGFAHFRGAEEFTAKSIGRAMDYFEKLPKFRTRNNELGVAAAVELKRYRNDLTKPEQSDLHNRIRYYIEHLSEGNMQKMPYKEHSIDVNVDQMKALNLSLEDVEMANRLVNTLAITKKHADYVVNGDYEGANNLPKKFKDVQGLELEDVSGMNQKDAAFGFVKDYFPIVPTKEYKNYLAEQSADETEIGFISHQLADLYENKKIDTTFFTRMRSYGSTQKGSYLKNSPKDRLSPADELLTYFKAIDNFYKGRGYQYFDQIESAHSIYNVINKYGREEQLARVQLLQQWRKQYDQAMNPKGLGDSWAAKLLSGVLGIETTLALSSPRMGFFNMFQGLELGGSMHGYGKHVAAMFKSLGESAAALRSILKGDFKKTDFIEECLQGKFERGLLYGDDAIVANNIVNYFSDEPISVINMADVSAVLYKGLDEKLRETASPAMRFLTKFGDFLTYNFKMSEKIARASTIDASTHHFLQVAKKVRDIAKANPEMSNPELVRMLGKELHLDALNNAWKTDKILSYVKGQNIGDALSDNKILQGMSREYAYASVKHQLYEYDAINQSWVKAKMKNVSGLAGIPLTFKSWGMYFTEYLAGAVAAYANGDKTPLRKFVAQSAIMLAATSFAVSLTENEKYKKGKPQEFSDFLKKGASGTAKYLRARNAMFTPLSIAGVGLDEIAGLGAPVVGGGLWLGAKAGKATAEIVTLGQADSEVFPYLERQGMDAMKHSVFWRKIDDMVNDGRELGLVPPKEK